MFAPEPKALWPFMQSSAKETLKQATANSLALLIHQGGIAQVKWRKTVKMLGEENLLLTEEVLLC